MRIIQQFETALEKALRSTDSLNVDDVEDEEELEEERRKGARVVDEDAVNSRQGESSRSVA